MRSTTLCKLDEDRDYVKTNEDIIISMTVDVIPEITQLHKPGVKPEFISLIHVKSITNNYYLKGELTNDGFNPFEKIVIRGAHVYIESQDFMPNLKNLDKMLKWSSEEINRIFAD